MICYKELDINCRTRGCVYEIICKQCKKKIKVKNKYRGQTSRSTYHRTNEHIDNWKKKKDDSPLWKHSVDYHYSEEFPIEMKILSRCFGKPTRRMITEAVMINEMDDEESMNNKNEYGYVKMPKVNVEET